MSAWDTLELQHDVAMRWLESYAALHAYNNYILDKKDCVVYPVPDAPVRKGTSHPGKKRPIPKGSGREKGTRQACCPTAQSERIKRLDSS